MFKVHNIESDGNEQTFESSGTCRELIFGIQGADLEIGDESGEDTFTIEDGDHLDLTGYDLRSTTFYLTADSSGETIEIIEMTGPRF